MRILSLILAAVLILALFAGCSNGQSSVDSGDTPDGRPQTAGEKAFTLFDKDGQAIARISDTAPGGGEYVDEAYAAYCDHVVKNMSDVISDQRECDADEAKRLAVEEEYRVYTYFDGEVLEAVKTAYDYYVLNNVNFASAMTDHDGKLICAFSSGIKKEYNNYAMTAEPPYSSIKPLSVYAPALDAGVINWSTTFLDAPIKTLTDVSGEIREWPSNATGGYANCGVTVADAVAVSLNTVAVRALKEFGVRNSMDFLSDRLGVDIDYEEFASSAEGGEDEVLSNIALGYLYYGISPIDMAGYYTMFANGGMYTKPHSVSRIEDREGNVIYEDDTKPEQIISPETSMIMRELLKLVVSDGGTGPEAAECGYEVAGKTGTGNGYIGNWFVGITPCYSMSVWYGEGRTVNICPKVFSMIAENAPYDESASYPKCYSVTQGAYCTESGGLIGHGCRKMSMGYYTEDNMPEKCSAH